MPRFSLRTHGPSIWLSHTFDRPVLSDVRLRPQAKNGPISLILPRSYRTLFFFFCRREFCLPLVHLYILMPPHPFFFAHLQTMYGSVRQVFFPTSVCLSVCLWSEGVIPSLLILSLPVLSYRGIFIGNAFGSALLRLSPISLGFFSYRARCRITRMWTSYVYWWDTGHDPSIAELICYN